MFFYYVAAPWNLIGRTDPVGGEAGYRAGRGARCRQQLKKTGATWIATTDYRTYAMLRWYFNGRVPVIQINERGRFQGFRDPGMDRIRGHAGLYVAREPDERCRCGISRPPGASRSSGSSGVWRGIVMDTYALEKLTGWTPELSPPPDTPLFRWRVLADNTRPRTVAAVTNDRDKRRNWEKPAMSIRIAALALSLCASALPAEAAEYPDHAIKMIVPFAAGGGTDVLARIIAQNLNSKWGQPVVVENQPGASGAIGTRAVMKAAPDGYTLLMASTGALMAVSASADGDGPFDVNKVLSPIVIGAAPPYLLVASPTLPVKTTADLIRYAKEKPEGLTFGSSGVGAASHLSGLLFASETGIKMLHVPYKGTGPAVTDLLGGRIDIMFAPGPVVQQFVQSGQLKALGVTDTQRSKFYPDVPPSPMPCRVTNPSAGSACWRRRIRRPRSSRNSTRSSWPRCRPRNSAIIWRRSAPSRKPQTPEEFGRYINADVAKWSKLVKDNDVQLPGGK